MHLRDALRGPHGSSLTYDKVQPQISPSLLGLSALFVLSVRGYCALGSESIPFYFRFVSGSLPDAVG